jgi:hypothetical protein
MVVTKADLSTNFPSSSSYSLVATGDPVSAQIENNNNAAWLALVTLLYNYCIDQTPQTGAATTYTALQSFSTGIAVDSIGSYTTNADINVTTTSTGKLKYNTAEVATQAFVSAAIASAGTLSLNLAWGGIKTSTFTPLRGFVYGIDTTSAAFSVNLPASPANGDPIGFVDLKGTWGANNFTIGRNGKSIMDLSEDLVCDISYAGVYLNYDTSGVWYKLGS